MEPCWANQNPIFTPPTLNLFRLGANRIPKPKDTANHKIRSSNK